MGNRESAIKRPSSPRSPDASRLTPHAALVIFAKAPIPGQVKTRLCPPLTPDEAATLHGSFVLDMLERTKTATTQFKLPLDRYLACAPSSTHVFFKIMEERQGVKLIDQVGDDLGGRMTQAFDVLFSRGYHRVVIVGTDVPTLPLDYFKQALAQLETHDLVLGPALDGGYYLIGLRKPAPDLFADIPWSTDRVLTLTQEKAHGLRLTTATIPPWRDVDTIEDLTALIEAESLDAKKPKNERAFSNRTAGALQLLAKRLSTRA
ncbi:MAG: TIGR04282 family arsenosugar biosynthesis glycosyltransferase [Nitrospira sp.]|nr:TIGR04282 family arsenosugar biosynthesis glycosyltransferase [Nitrospira sp.]MDH4328207.1 TIGR04282 family arsenosugar biosynthesis glycosyltransferase [Nitrospira sp.]